MQKTILLIGLAILIVGLVWPWLSKLPLGRLPGDIIVNKENMKFYFPITTMILLSVILTLILNFLKK